MAGSTFSLSRKKAEADQLEKTWRNQRQTRTGYSDPEHPFRYQGEGKPYTYKLFLELGYALLRDGGEMGLIVPSGIYTDKGATALRRLFLSRCNWRWLFVFENREGIFDAVDSRFKFCPVIVQKGGRTDAIQTRFMERHLEAWEKAEPSALAYPRAQVERFSPYTRAILELRTAQDLKILEKMYANGVLLGDDGPQGWGIQYRQGDFNMTSDSKLFPPRPKWEAQGYRPDEYGHWLKGNWQPYSGEASILKRPEGLVLSADGEWAIALTEVEDIALPLMQGAMLHQFDFSQKGWLSGTGLRAKWESIFWEDKRLQPQFLMGQKDFNRETAGVSKPVIRRIARNTDTRMMISCYSPAIPCGDVASVLLPTLASIRPALVGCLNSYVTDFIVIPNLFKLA